MSERQSDHDLLIEVRKDVVYIKKGLDEISAFLKDCPAHRQQVANHLEHHRSTTTILIAIFGSLAGIAGALLVHAIFR